MWRDEVGMMEMLLSYISEFNQFESWSNWRPILVEILSFHEDKRLGSCDAMMRSVKRRSQTYAKEVKCRKTDIFVGEDSRTESLKATTSNNTDNGQHLSTPFDSERDEIEMLNEKESNDQIFLMNETKGGDEQSYFTTFETSTPVLPRNTEDQQTSVFNTLQLYSTPAAGGSLVEGQNRWQIKVKDEYIKEEFISCSKPGSSGNGFSNDIIDFAGNIDRMGAMVDLTDCGSPNGTALPICRESGVLKCLICGKIFRRKNDLTVHHRVHTGERPYKCEVCDKSFTVKSSLVLHRHSHTGVRPFSCDICGRTFARKYCYKIHMRTHTGERPYACTICGKSFTQSGILYLHLRRHEAQELQT